MTDLRKLRENEVEFDLECLPEHVLIRGNAIASGDDEYDKEVEYAILADLAHNPWAWCIAKVTAKWMGFEGTDYLGCCSYANRGAFINDQYYADMKATALVRLNDELQNNHEILEELEQKQIPNNNLKPFTRLALYLEGMQTALGRREMLDELLNETQVYINQLEG